MEMMNGTRAIAVLAFSLLGLLMYQAQSSAQGVLDPDELVLVTEDLAIYTDGCDAVSVFRSDSTEVVFRGETHISPGRLAATSDLNVALASPSNGAIEDVIGGSWNEFLYIAASTDSSLTKWTSGIVLGTDIATLGGIAVLPGDEEFLAATSAKTLSPTYVILKNKPPFFVKKYLVPRRVVPEQTIRPALGKVQVDAMVVAILVSPDGRHAYLLEENASVYTLDFHTMEIVGGPIRLPSFIAPPNVFFGKPINRMHAALSMDGRYLVANRGDSNELSIADLVERTSWTLTTSPDIKSIGGVALNWTQQNAGLLALHANDKVVVYQWAPRGPLREVGRIAITPPHLTGNPFPDGSGGPKNSIAWSGDGKKLIAATEAGTAEFIVI